MLITAGHSAELVRLGPALTAYIIDPRTNQYVIDPKANLTVEYSAIFDTAAPINSMEETLVTDLRLPMVRPGDQLETTDGPKKRNVHTARISIPILNIDRESTEFYPLNLDNIFHGGHQIILGRRFLQRFKLVYDGRTGSVTIEF